MPGSFSPNEVGKLTDLAARVAAMYGDAITGAVHFEAMIANGEVCHVVDLANG